MNDTRAPSALHELDDGRLPFPRTTRLSGHHDRFMERTNQASVHVKESMTMRTITSWNAKINQVAMLILPGGAHRALGRPPAMEIGRAHV